MMMTTTMMMPPAKKARHNGYSYLETDRFFLNSSGGSGLGHDGFSPRSIRQSSHGSQMARELSADREEFRVLGPNPSSRSRAVPPQGPSPRTVFHPSQEISKPSGFSLDFSEVGSGSSTQRTSRAFDMEPPSLRVDTIEFPRRTTTTPSRGAEANDAPLDLSTLSTDNLLRRTPDDDQTFSRSGNSIPFTGRSSSGGYDFRSGSDGGQRQMEETATPQLPLFVNLENSRLESIQLGLQSRRGHDTAEQESDETKLSDPTGWERMMDCETESDVEPPRRQKKTIDRLRAHIERRQEARPASGTAYASLSKHLAAIEATRNRYEAVHGMTFGELQEAKATRSKTSKTSFRSITEADAQGRSYAHFSSEKEIPIRNPEEVPDQQKRSLSGLAIGGLQQKLHDQRLKETKLCLQNGTLRNREPVSDGGQCYAVTLENDNASRKGLSSGVALRRHPTGHSHMSDHTMGQTQTDIQLQDWILAATESALHPSKFPNFNASIHTTEVTPFTCAWRPSRPEAEPEPDSPSSHSLPDFSRGSNLAVSTQSQVLRRPASIDTGFPSSDKRLAMNDVAVMVTDRGGNGGGRTLETCSPDQSTNYRNYSADNLPSIIASARLDDDCEFISSYAETPKGTMARNHPHHPIDKSPNASFHNRRHTVLNGSVGTGLSSSPEPPSSTFEDEPVADKSKGEDNNIKATESAIPCKICQDVANGFHYGVWSCEGCKAFFKRSITGSAKYVCPADNNCTINRLRKKSCQACRLRKCYEYGMSPGNCRGENGSRIRKRKLQEADRKEDSTNSANGDDRRMNSASIQNLSGNVLHPVPTVHHNFHNHPTVNEPASGPVSILQHLLAVERPIRFAEFVDVRTSMDGADSERIQLLTSITKLVNLQLMDVVTWSRSLPGFNAVNLNIRTHLLVSSWSEILLLTSAFYSLQCTNAIAMAPNLHLTKERCEVIGMTAPYNRLMPIVKSFQQLALTHSEMLLMQALLLVNADLTASQLIPRLDGLRASLMRSWHQSCAGSQGQGFVDYDRISRLLMLLPHIRHCSLLFQRFLSELKRDGRIPFSGFLEEVTDGRHDLHQVSVLELLVEEEADL